MNKRDCSVFLYLYILSNNVLCNNLAYAAPQDVQHMLNCFWRGHMESFMVQRDDIMRMALHDNVSPVAMSDPINTSTAKDTSAMIKVYRELYSNLIHVGCTVFKCDAKTLVMSISGLDGYVCKMPGYKASFSMRSIQHHVRRVFLAHKLSRYCEKNNLLDCVKVPVKYVYRLPGCEDFLCTEQYLVVAQRCNITKINSYDQLPLKHVQALVDIVGTFGLDDLTGDNVGIDECGRVVFIDTEDDIWGRSLQDMKLFVSKVCKQQGLGIALGDGMDERVIKKIYRRMRGLQALLRLRCFLISKDKQTCVQECISRHMQSVQ